MDSGPSSSHSAHQSHQSQRAPHATSSTSTQPRTIAHVSTSRGHYSKAGTRNAEIPANLHHVASRTDKGKGKAPAATLHELDAAGSRAHDASPVDRASRRDRDIERNRLRQSHGLSWSSVTRDSVVDNLLLSFDRMASLDMHEGPNAISSLRTHALEDAFDLTSSPPMLQNDRLNRARGHTYSSSMSSDLDDVSSRYSRNITSRGGRSNSGSNLATPPRISRTRDKNTRGLSRSSSEAQHTYRDGPHHRRGITSKSSKSSNASSFEYGYGQIISTDTRFGKLAHPASDNDMTHRAPDPNSVLSRGRPVPSVFSAYEAQCPEPNVPRGPSNVETLSHSTSQTPFSLNFSALPQHFTSRPGTDSRSPPNTSDIPQSIRDQASDFVKASTIREGEVSHRIDQAASNHASFAPSQQGSLQKHVSPTPEAAQRPGFFRRVFGTSRTTSSDPHRQLSRDTSSYQDLSAPNRQRASPSPNPAHAVPQLRSEPKLTKVDATAPTAAAATAAANYTSPSPAPGPPLTHVINKKASFFRRRKKSISQDHRPPSIPNTFLPASESHPDGLQHPPSPGASSLTRIMDQYLGNSVNLSNRPNDQEPPVKSPTGDTEEDSDGMEAFHSGYTPPPDASLRRPAPLEHQSSLTKAHNARPEPSHSFSDAAELANPDDLQPTIRQSKSFLADSSDVDDKDRRTRLSAISVVSSMFGRPEDVLLSPTDSDDQPPRPYTVPEYSSTPADEDFIVSQFPKPGAAPRIDTQKERIRLEPTKSEEELADSISLPVEGPRTRVPGSQDEEIDSPNSLPIFQVNESTIRPSVDIARAMENVQSPSSDEPTEEDRERAQKIFHGSEDFIPKDQVAAWLGERSAISARTLVAFMELFDWAGQNILSALRLLCSRLTMRAESQQVDRILSAMANRWDECNPNNGFKGTGVIHNLCFALLLLNTDQHMADIQHKMTRSEFIKNTTPAIRNAAQETVKAAQDFPRPPIPWQNSGSTMPTSPTLNQGEAEDRSSVDGVKAPAPMNMKRLSLRPHFPRGETDPGPGDNHKGSSNTLVNQPWHGSEKLWLLEIEEVLKYFYSSIVADALPLHVSRAAEGAAQFSVANNLSVGGAVLRRTGSVISKSPSEGFAYRGRRLDTNTLTSRWHSKNRSRQKMYPASSATSRTSLDDGNSMLSPAGSSMWSKISMGKTQTSMSVESLAMHSDFQKSVGFTNALSQAIIREESTTNDSDSFHRVGSLLEDESLELFGAPWAKEGIVKHKHHLDGPEKKAKERSWHECFAVVEKGYVHLFSFNRNPTTRITASTLRARRNTGKSSTATPSVVGGGNWTENAEELGKFLLRQTIATTLPEPGYSKTRPHVWALSLPSGAVHLFQVGTGEIAEEFATTANYWSARLSKEPLVGGVDNIEYGWSDDVLNPALLSQPQTSTTTTTPPASRGRSGTTGTHKSSPSVSTQLAGTTSPAPPAPRPSVQGSLRSSLDQSFSTRPRLPGDKATITEWKPPAASMLPSALLEIDQLRSLRAYVSSVEQELQRHNDLQAALPLAFRPGGPNFNKVTANWERKSAYLLREVVKFRTYTEALDRARTAKEEIYKERTEREEEKAAREAKASGAPPPPPPPVELQG